MNTFPQKETNVDKVYTTTEKRFGVFWVELDSSESF